MVSFKNMFKCGSKNKKKVPDTAPNTPTTASEPLVCGTCSTAQSVPLASSAFVCVSCHSVNRVDRTNPQGTMVQSASQSAPSGSEVTLVRMSSTVFLPVGEAPANAQTYSTEKMPEVPKCSVCLDNPGDMVVQPCAHGGLCEPCAMHIANNEAVGGAHCPKCRGDIGRLLRITRLPNGDTVTAVEVPLPTPIGGRRKAPPKVPPPPGQKKNKEQNVVVATAA